MQADLITPHDLAKATAGDGSIKAKEVTIRRQCRDGTIPSVKIGSRWYIPMTALGDAAPPIPGEGTSPDLADALSEWLVAGMAIMSKLRGGKDAV